MQSGFFVTGRGKEEKYEGRTPLIFGNTTPAGKLMTLQEAHERIAKLAKEEKMSEVGAWALRESSQAGMLTLDVCNQGSVRFAYTKEGWIFVGDRTEAIKAAQEKMIPLTKESASEAMIKQLYVAIQGVQYGDRSKPEGMFRVDLSKQIKPKYPEDATKHAVLCGYVQEKIDKCSTGYTLEEPPLSSVKISGGGS